ncbi:MAG: response regulator [Methylococcales bacterium]|jgi:two-component system, chemotaxis family, chemotaxis protein CheY|nr:response regulator [Methylococcales bacterium]MBT7408463.1 response regulator [Methylococcales bacterium]
MKKPSILIADDVVEMRLLMASMLRELKLNDIIDVSDGEKVLRVYKTKKTDIVFLDINMPGKDGLQCLEEILKIRSDAYVVMVSGESSIDNVKKALSLGAKGFIVKPYNMKKVSDIIKGYVKFKNTPQHIDH